MVGVEKEASWRESWCVTNFFIRGSVTRTREVCGLWQRSVIRESACEIHDAGSNGRSNASIRKERTVETVSFTLLPICEKNV